MLANKDGVPKEDAAMLYRYARTLKCGDQVKVELKDEKTLNWHQRKAIELEERSRKKRCDS